MTWTCQRQSAGVVCKHENDGRARKCRSCGKPRPRRERPAHLVALELSYECYIDLNGGEQCAICGSPPVTRRLNRDHDHRTHRPRGLLCPYCNQLLPNRVTPEWLRAAADYLERARSPEFAEKVEAALSAAGLG